MRNYIWDFQTVEALADLEIETYKRFPNLDVLASDFIKLKSLVGSTDVYHDDDEFQKSFTKYENLLNDTDSISAAIYALGDSAKSGDILARESIANLSVILFELQ